NPACDNATFGGAILGLFDDELECGIPQSGPGAFETERIYTSDVMQDVTSSRPVDPCRSLLGLDPGETCYRMWYTGQGPFNIRQIIHAVSADGITWQRHGPVLGGSGIEGRFDQDWVSIPSVIRDRAEGPS